jgi:hypothetical protein
MKYPDFMNDVKIKPSKVYPLLEIFKNLENSKVLAILFPDKNKRIEFLGKQRIIFSKKCTCCNVMNTKYITFPYSYLNDKYIKEFYIDIIHELTHCWQREKKHINFREMEKEIPYTVNLEELEAYALGLVEAKKIGMTKKEYRHYIEGDDFLSEREKKELYGHVLKFKLK